MVNDSELQAYINATVNTLKNSQPHLLNERIVNAPFEDKLISVKLGLGVVVLLVVNTSTNTIDRIELSNTELAKGAVEVSAKRFHEIKIPVDDKENAIALSVRTGELQIVDDWKYLFTPELNEDEARMNQAGAAIGCSLVQSFKGNNISGALICSFFQEPTLIAEHHKKFIKAYAHAVGEALDTPN